MVRLCEPSGRSLLLTVTRTLYPDGSADLAIGLASVTLTTSLTHCSTEPS